MTLEFRNWFESDFRHPSCPGVLLRLCRPCKFDLPRGNAGTGGQGVLHAQTQTRKTSLLITHVHRYNTSQLLKHYSELGLLYDIV